MHHTDIVKNPFATREQELLLQAALLNADQALAAWHRWLDSIDFENEMDQGSFRLLPLLFCNLKKHDVDHPIMHRLKGIYRHAWYNNHKLFFELSRILRCINAAGVPTMVIKGAALTVMVYKNFAIRPMADIDILVPEDRVELTNRLLNRAGWSSPSNLPVKRIFKFRHSLGFQNCQGLEFDLHWHPVRYSRIIASEKHHHDAFWENALPIKIVDEPTLAPGLPESLFLTIIHSAWSNQIPPIRWIPDAIYLIDAIRAQADWARFTLLAEKYSVPLQVNCALGYLQEKFDAGIPKFVFDALNQIPVTFPQRLVFKHSLGQTREDGYSIIGRIPGVVEYLRVSGDRGWYKLLTGFPEFVKYRVHKMKLKDLLAHIVKKQMKYRV